MLIKHLTHYLKYRETIDSFCPLSILIIHIFRLLLLNRCNLYEFYRYIKQVCITDKWTVGQKIIAASLRSFDCVSLWILKLKLINRLIFFKKNYVCIFSRKINNHINLYYWTFSLTHHVNPMNMYNHWIFVKNASLKLEFLMKHSFPSAELLANPHNVSKIKDRQCRNW